jgi:hypothetical protein
MSRRLLILMLALALPLTIGACGGDDDDGGDDADEITEVIETSVKSTDPANCTELQTAAFTDQTNLANGDAALQECEDDAADTSGDPDSVEVSDIAVDGESATASVAFTGGSLDGSTVALELVKEGDQWKLDEITDITEFDFEAFQVALGEQLFEQGDISAQTAQCIDQAIREAGADQVEEIFLSGDGTQLDTLFAGC